MDEPRDHPRADWEGRMLRLMVENVRDYAIFVIDPEGLIRSWNAGAERLLGYPAREALGRPVDLIFTAGDVRAGEPARERIAALTTGRGEDDRWHVRKDGSLFWCSGMLTPLRDASGYLHGFAKLMRDRTEWNRRAEALAEQSRITEALNRIGTRLASEHELGRLVEFVTEEATRLTGARYGALFYNVPDEQGGSYTLYTIAGAPREAFATFPMPRATDLFGPTFRGEGPVRLDDVTADPRYGRSAPHRGMPEGHLPVRSYLAVPVVSRGSEVLGGLFFGHPEPGVFAEKDERLAVGIAAQAAVAIDNARLYSDLHTSERRFRQLADAVPQVVWDSNPDGSVSYFNRRWYEYTGLTPEQSLGDHGWARAIHPDDLAALLHAAESLPADRIFEAEYRLRRHDGAYRWHLGRAIPVIEADGSIRHRFGTATDIDDRRRSEQTARFLADASAALAGLVDYEETLRRVAGMAVPAFADWCAVDMEGPDGTLRRLAVTHPDPEKLRVARELFERYPPNLDDPGGIGKVTRTGEPELVHELTDAMIEAGIPDPEQLRMLRILALRSYICVPLRPRGGTPGCLTFVTAESGRLYGPDDLRIAEDLARRATVAIENASLYQALQEADRSKGELLESLREGEERFRTMAESIPQLAWMARPDGSVYWFNRRWYDYTGTTPEQMTGWGWQAVHDPAVLPSVLERFRASIATGEPFDMTFPLRGADGQFRSFLTRMLPVRGDDGRILHWFGTNTDITDRLRIEEELRSAKEEAEAASQAKSQFLAVLSHELRTPLNPILLAASSLLERPSDPQEIRPTLEMIRHNVHLQARLIDDLLDVMRIVRGKMPLHWEVVDGHRLIRQAVEICRSEILGRRLAVTIDLAAPHHHVNADPARLQQVVWNLIKNAVKFTPEGGILSVRTRAEDGPPDRIAIEIRDTGIGIEPEVLPRIFDPFQQGETTITRKFGGLGLGLAICKGIVDAHGGTISAHSEGRGRGTTFRVVLNALPEPAADGPEGGVTSERAPKSDGAHLPANLRVLVVEDEPATLRLMGRLLRGLGHEVTTAGTIAEGIAAAVASDFDLIVSDIGLPDGSGLDLIREVVARRGPVPAIALTGYGMEEDIRRSREAGFTAHLTKPIDFAKLEAMIRQVAPTRG